METIDKQCHCDKCEARTKKTYTLVGHCYNCGRKHIGTFRFGDRPPLYCQAVCPYCGVSDVHYGPMPEDTPTSSMWQPPLDTSSYICKDDGSWQTWDAQSIMTAGEAAEAAKSMLGFCTHMVAVENSKKMMDL